MKLMLMKTMIIMSILSTIIKTPMSMMLILLTQTMVSIMFMNKMSPNSWFALITFLMMMGGLLIIFMYMSSISSNEKFKINMKKTILMIIMMYYIEEMMMETQINEKENILIKYKDQIPMLKMYNKTMTMTILMTIYLTLTLISVNKIIKNFKGPLRSKTYEQNITKK